MQRAVETASPRSRAGILPIVAKDLRIDRGGRSILDGVDFAFGKEPGLSVLLGPNGAGKSVLVRTLADLIQPDTGSVTWAGTAPCRVRKRQLGFVFQKPVLLRRSVEANITFALDAVDIAKAEWPGKTAAALAAAGLSALAGQPARSLSGGEQQRLALARAMACAPDLLVLDEPAASLDPASTAAIEAQLKAISAAGTPCLLITHDLAQARRLADRVAFMHRGRILEVTAAEVFFASPKSAQAAAFLRGEIVL